MKSRLFWLFPLVLAGCSSTPPSTAELLNGPPGLSAYQVESNWLDRVVFTHNGEAALWARLRLQDRGADFDGTIAGQEVVGRCHTSNGFSLELDCKLFKTADGSPYAHLRVPLH